MIRTAASATKQGVDVVELRLVIPAGFIDSDIGSRGGAADGGYAGDGSRQNYTNGCPV
jgi:hypothetical protein